MYMFLHVLHVSYALDFASTALKSSTRFPFLAKTGDGKRCYSGGRSVGKSLKNGRRSRRRGHRCRAGLGGWRMTGSACRAGRFTANCGFF